MTLSVENVCEKQCILYYISNISIILRYFLVYNILKEMKETIFSSRNRCFRDYHVSIINTSQNVHFLNQLI